MSTHINRCDVVDADAGSGNNPGGHRDTGGPLREIALRSHKDPAAEIEPLHKAGRQNDEFLAILGHELRNTLAGILSAIEVLDRAALEPADAAEMRSVIRRQAVNMSRLVDGLLDMTRIAHGKFDLQLERLDLAALLRNAASDNRHAIESQNGTLRLDLPPGPVWCDGDRTRLGQVVGNLVGNAAKFLNGPGEVTVELRTNHHCREATIEVRDTGIGMEPRILADIFEPFVQAEHSREQSHGGLGIGLALVKGLVELHGGDVTAASAGLGHGSQFIVSLPTCPSQVADVHEDEKVTTPVIRKRVLLIDDRRDAILPTKVMLEMCGHEVATSADGLSAIVLARQFAPQVILCDIGLSGGLDGFDVAAAIRSDAELRTAYIVAVTGYGREEDRRQCQAAGFDYHLTKPVSFSELETVMTNMPRFQE